jgi:hypothetical protein
MGIFVRGIRVICGQFFLDLSDMFFVRVGQRQSVQAARLAGGRDHNGASVVGESVFAKSCHKMASASIQVTSWCFYTFKIRSFKFLSKSNSGSRECTPSRQAMKKLKNGRVEG